MEKHLVIIPTYNEAENILLIINAVLALDDSFDILVVDDSSPDGTSQLVRGHENYESDLFLLERNKKNGLANAYFDGFDWGLERDYSHIYEMDADFSHNPEDLSKLKKALRENDISVGSRYYKGVNVVNWPMSRVLLSYGASLFVRSILGLPVKDSTAGFVGYRAQVLQEIGYRNITQKGYGFQVEMKFRGWVKGFKIQEVSIIFTDRVRGESKISSGIIYEAIWGIFVLKWKKWFGRL